MKHEMAQPIRSLTPPPLAENLVERPDLFGKLDALKQVTFIQGLTGVGKSTLAAQWARSRQAQGDLVFWVNASNDRDIQHLLDLHDELTTGQRTIIVCDNAQDRTDESFLGLLSDLLAAHPNLHLVISSRERHPFRDRARELHQTVAKLTAMDMNASHSLLPSYANSWGQELSSSQAHDLFCNIGGWLAPTRIALENRDSRRDPMGMHAAGAYLREEVLPAIVDDDALTVAMVLSSVDELDELTVKSLFAAHPLLPALLRGETPALIMGRVERHGLLRRDEESPAGQRWTFPKLVKEALIVLAAARCPDLVKLAHSVLARSLDTDQLHDRSDAVLRHARAAQDWDFLAEKWAEKGLHLSVFHETEMVHAYSNVPESALSEFPSLALAASVASALTAPEGRSEITKQLRNYGEAGWAVQPVFTENRTLDTLTVASQCIHDRARGRLLNALRVGREHSASATHASVETRAWFDLQWGLSLLAAGQGFIAEELFTSAANTARAAGADFIVSAAAGQLALLYAYSGHTRDAWLSLTTQRNIDTSSFWLHKIVTSSGFAAEGYLKLDELEADAVTFFDLAGGVTDDVEEWAAILWGRTQHAILFGDPLVTLAEINRVVSMHEGRMHPQGRDQHAIDRCFAEVLLALGEYNRAERHLADAGNHVQTLVPAARLALLSGDPAKARSLAVASAWDPAATLRDRSELLMIKAAAAMSMGDPEGASKAFASASALATESGSLLPYAMLSRESFRALLEVSDAPLSANSIARIESVNDPWPVGGELVSLTPRELSVLLALEEHETLAAIADAFTVSLNTVKKQAAAVYAKLGVHDRGSALLKAHRLGMLPDSDSSRRQER